MKDPRDFSSTQFEEEIRFVVNNASSPEEAEKLIKEHFFPQPLVWVVLAGMLGNNRVAVLVQQYPGKNNISFICECKPPPSKDGDYNVVLRHTKAAGGYAGIVTWTSFRSKTEFDAWNTKNKTEEVLAENVTTDEAVRIVRANHAPFRNYLHAAVQDATDPETGKVNLEIAELHAKNAIGVRALDS